MKSFPLFITVEARPLVVFGGGEEAAAKLRLLLKTEAQVIAVASAFEAAVANLQLYGPTNFAEFLRMAASLARAADVSQANQEYFVLLVLTDGVITDMQDTISTIVDASSLPLSVSWIKSLST